MTIADAFNEITIAQGGTPNYSGTIASAIDALNDALAGSDQPAETTIEGAVRLLGQHIGGGSSVTVEALSATENKTYTAPEGKAYSPVTVNVAAQPVQFEVETENCSALFYVFSNDFDPSDPGTPITAAVPGTVVYGAVTPDGGYTFSNLEAELSPIELDSDSGRFVVGTNNPFHIYVACSD